MIAPVSSLSSYVNSAVWVYGIAAGALVVYNIRWRYIGTLFGSKPKLLPLVKVNGNESHSKKKHPVVLLLHGMWHDASWFQDLQQVLQKQGYTSYAVELLPGERMLPGFTQREIVADLEATLAEEDNDYILLGHSQGGLLVQSCMKNSPFIRGRTKAAVLLGTYPLGLTPPLKKLLEQPRNMYTKLGYLWICLCGSLMNVDYLKHIFLLPTTDETTLKHYTDKLLAAPSDGLITMSHFPSSVGIISTKPALVLGAQQDILYPPHLLQEDFQARFPNSTHVVVPSQGHCFMDPINAAETSMAQSLLKWLDAL